MALPAHMNKPVLSAEDVVLPLPSLIPIRINVISTDHTIRIVDTLLWDLSLGSDEHTAHALAHQFLTDLEVQGMTRSSRHFTGRVDMWNAKAQQLIQNQIQVQLDAAQRITNLQRQEEAANKRKRIEQEYREKMDASEDEGKETAGPAADKASTTSDQKPSDASEHKQPGSPSPKKKKRRTIIPIRLRLILNGIRVHDDFEWDCSLQHLYTPLDMARDLGRDLNLNDDAVQAIAIEITEQIVAFACQPTASRQPTPASDYHGWKENDVEVVYRQLQKQYRESKSALMLVFPSSTKDISPNNTTAAWEMDSRTNATHTTYLVSQQKPGKSGSVK